MAVFKANGGISGGISLVLIDRPIANIVVPISEIRLDNLPARNRTRN